MKLFLRLISLTALCAISACGISTGCDDYHSYRYTEVQSTVNVPADLEQPVNESIAPKTEASDPNKVDRNAAGECLEKPPKL